MLKTIKNRKLIFLSISVLPIFFSGLFAGLSPCKEAAPPAATLEFWSVFDDSDIYQPLITEFKTQYPYITINYYKKSVSSYEKDLVDALAAGRGPDIFSIHNTWLPKHEGKLAAAPDTLITPQRFKEVFVDAAAQDFIDGGKIYAFPFAIDTLALFYNKDLLNSAGIVSPPKTWAEFNADVEKLVIRDSKNNILQAGAALGTARNINRSTDILVALMLQSGAKMVSDDHAYATFEQSASSGAGESLNPGLQALLYYTNFANPTKRVYTWNQYQHYSIDAFIEGKAAMMLNYAYQIPTIKARSPHLNFAVAPLPQISLTGTKVNFANYWGQAVAKNSQYQAYAWQFLAWLAGAESQKKYLAATQKPAVRRDLIEAQKSDEVLGLFSQQALSAKSWWQVDNSANELIFADMIESVVSGSAAAEDALRAASQRVTLLMNKGTGQ